MAKVSIIILSYNTETLLSDCLQSVFSQIKSDSEVIVVDNASSDKSVEMIEKNFPQVSLIKNKENSGFAKGCNLGAKEAKGEYLLFLNSDTLVSSDPLPSMLKVMEEKGEVGVVGGKMINHDGTTQRSFGNFYTLKNVARLLFLGENSELKKFKSESQVQTDWVSGGFMLVRKDVFEKVKGFDENFFMYIEDMELCYRIKKSGFKIVFVPDAIVEHLGQGSSNKTFAIVNIYKGLGYFYKKHRSKVEYMIVRLMLRLKAWLALTIGTVKGNKYLVDTYQKALRAL